MKYRERYAKQAAINLYRLGKPKAVVVEMLVREGAGERANALADEYYANYEFVVNYHQKRKLTQANYFLLIGSVLVFSSLAYGVVTYLGLKSGYLVLLSGLLVSGIMFTVKGLADKSAK